MSKTQFVSAKSISIFALNPTGERYIPGITFGYISGSTISILFRENWCSSTEASSWYIWNCISCWFVSVWVSVFITNSWINQKYEKSISWFGGKCFICSIVHSFSEYLINDWFYHSIEMVRNQIKILENPNTC